MKRNKFSLSNTQLLTCNMGELVPVGLTEVLPGDTFEHSTSLLLRASPLLSPVMHPVKVRIHHWFCPTRVVWTDFQKFITGGPDGLDATAVPTISITNASVGTLADYLGIPTGVASARTVSAIPFRMYNLIWNNFYRDQDLQTELAIGYGNGADGTTASTLQNVCWEKDYFTSSRPWTQKGTAATLPLGTSAPVTRVSNSTSWDVYVTGTDTKALSQDLTESGAGVLVDKTPRGITLDPKGGLIADLSTATAATINQLRDAFAIQKYEEARARYGSRYTEYLRYLGIKSSDARLQLPEYLGGGKATIQFSEVLQSGVTTSGTPNTGVGSLLGHGIGATRSNRYRRFFEEHGYVLSLMSVLPKTIYATGLPKTWLRTSKTDYFQKELQHVGSQAIQNQEVYMAHATPTGTFGYQDRYDEYRRTESGVHGDFRTTLNYWHYARLFGSTPALNSSFVSADPTTRVYQSTSADQLYVMASHSIRARRLLAKTGTAGGI